MSQDNTIQILTEREFNIAFNMGLEAAVFVLENSENMSPEGTRYLLKKLKEQIRVSEIHFKGGNAELYSSILPKGVM